MIVKREQDFSRNIKNFKERVTDSIDKVNSQYYGKIKNIEDRIEDKIKLIKNGKDGKDADEARIENNVIEALRSEIPNIKEWEDSLPMLGEQIRNALELLQGQARLEMSAIKGLEERLKELERQPETRMGGVSGFNYGAMQLHFLSWTETSVAPNGVLTDFVIGYSPNPVNSLEVMVDNSPLFETSDWTYTYSTKTISFLVAPPLNSKVRYKCLI